MLDENDNSSIVDRLMQIVTAESATIETKNGPVENELTADNNSLAAAKSLFGLNLRFLKNRDDDLGGVALTVRHQNAILDRLMQIVAKQTVTKWTKNGSVVDEVAADKNSIAAAKFLIGLQKKHGRFKRGGDRESGRGGDRNAYACVLLTIQHQHAIVERLMQILNKTFVIRQTKYGPFEDEVIADQNAIRAASVLVSYEALSIERPIAPCSREGEIPGAPGRRRGGGGDRETEMLLRASVASEVRRAGDGSGTAGSSASHASESRRAGDGCKIGESIARSLREGEIGRQGDRETETPTLESHASEPRRAGDGLETGKSVAGCEPDLAPSELGFTAEDVVREALKIVARDRPDFVDKIDKHALIERVRAKLDRAARESRGLQVESRPVAAREEIPLLRRESCDEKVESRQRAAKNLEKIA